MAHIEYRSIKRRELRSELFEHFIRHQVVNLCYRKIDDDWDIVSDPFIDDWNEDEYAFLIDCLKNTLMSSGFVYGAFVDGKLKGFCSVESDIFDPPHHYCDLSSLHVSKDMRHQGIGKNLFQAAVSWAKAHGAKKLYVSAHSAYETQLFYKAMGCCEASSYHAGHVAAEPYDCQLEYRI